MGELSEPTQRSPWHGVILFVLGAAVFGAIYAQAPLYYSNQNQYFLHGLAQASRGELSRDWLANTSDPTPVFTALVAFTARYLGEIWFHVYYFVIFGIYLAALVMILPALEREPTPGKRLAYVLGLLVLHAAILRWLCARVSGWDYLQYLHSGLAGQYLLGAMYQPSVHGVLLLLSVALFVRGKPIVAGLSAATAAVLHATYLLSAGLLIISYLILLARQRRWREALLTSFVAFLMVLPIIVYNLRRFAPTDPETFAQAERILVHFRIPHHTAFAWWIDRTGLFQMAWMLLGLVLLWPRRAGSGQWAVGSERNRETENGAPRTENEQAESAPTAHAPRTARHAPRSLFGVYLLVLLFSLALTLVQAWIDSDTLALLFPWRMSVVLVPLATAVILIRLIEWTAPCFGWVPAMLPSVLAMVAIAGLVAGGICVGYHHLLFRIDAAEEPLLRWVRAHAGPGDRYLIPIQLPPAQHQAYERGELFHVVKPTSKKLDLIPVDLQRFRLFTGVPIHVDFKSIPYRDVDLVEWFERLLWTLKLYKRAGAGKIDWRAELASRGITHVVAGPGQAFQSDQLELLYEDERYKIYRLRADAAKD